MTGNPSEEVQMKFEFGLFNDVIKVPHFYDVYRNLNYIVVEPFPYPCTYRRLDAETNELEPVKHLVDDEVKVECDPNMNPVGSIGSTGGTVKF